MYRAARHRKGGFLHSLRKRRMGVAGARQVFRRAAEFHQHGRLVDQFAGLGPTMWTPSTRSVFASASTFTKPSVVWFALARPLARNRNLPAL